MFDAGNNTDYLITDELKLLIDNSGTIAFNEFTALWRYIDDWKRCFQAFDVDRSGSINESEMGNALRNFGFNVSPKFIHTLIQKFDRYGKLSFYHIWL
jgi:Ca2+-binding EF-hand superfamily protein